MNAFSPALQRFGDVCVRLSVELGRTEMPLRDVLSLGEGSVVPLNKLTDELLDVTANGKVVARGEVVAQDGRFALRIVSLADGEGDAASTANDAPAFPGGAGQSMASTFGADSAQTPADLPSQSSVSDAYSASAAQSDANAGTGQNTGPSAGPAAPPQDGPPS